MAKSTPDGDAAIGQADGTVRNSDRPVSKPGTVDPLSQPTKTTLGIQNSIAHPVYDADRHAGDNTDLDKNEPQNVHEVDEDSDALEEYDEVDSALGDDESIYAATLDSTIRNHVWENGRRYHAFRAGSYLYPNDETELNREDMKDHMTQLMLDGKLTFADFARHPTDVLDLGTGTGKWAMDFADDYPGCRVLAVDLSPVQPTCAPSNLEFQVDDIESDWTYDAGSFDYIHVRYMATAIKDWQTLLKRCYETLRPGGIIEIIDMDLIYTSDDGTVLPENRLSAFLEQITSANATRGVSLRIAPELPIKLTEVGFTDVRYRTPKLPLGWWPKDNRMKEIGIWQYSQFTDALQGIAMATFTKVLGWQPAEVEVMLAGIRDEIRDQNIHGYWRNYFMTAQKW